MLHRVLIQLLLGFYEKLSRGPYSASKKLKVRMTHIRGGLCEFRDPTPVDVECLILSNQQTFLFRTGNRGCTLYGHVFRYRNDFGGVDRVRVAACWTGYRL